jgi:hypothetical protein
LKLSLLACSFVLDRLSLSISKSRSRHEADLAVSEVSFISSSAKSPIVELHSEKISSIQRNVGLKVQASLLGFSWEAHAWNLHHTIIEQKGEKGRTIDTNRNVYCLLKTRPPNKTNMLSIKTRAFWWYQYQRTFR